MRGTAGGWVALGYGAGVSTLEQRLASMPVPTSEEERALWGSLSAATLAWVATLDLPAFKRLLAYRRAVQAGLYRDWPVPASQPGETHLSLVCEVCDTFYCRQCGVPCDCYGTGS